MDCNRQIFFILHPPPKNKLLGSLKMWGKKGSNKYQDRIINIDKKNGERLVSKKHYQCWLFRKYIDSFIGRRGYANINVWIKFDETEKIYSDIMIRSVYKLKVWHFRV